MKAATPVLLPLLRSRTQGNIIAHLVLNPDQEHTPTQIAADLCLSLPTVVRETTRLVEAGLVRSTKRGNTTLLRVDTTNPVYRPLSDLMAVTFGPLPVLRSLLAQVDGIEEAYLYGSWAARYQGHPGQVPGDLDVLVIGSPDREALAEAIDVAEQTLRREVNARRVSRTAWDSDEGSIKATITSRPMARILPVEGEAQQ